MMNHDIPQQPKANPHNALCSEVLELVPAYVVGAAEAAEIELIENMLHDCPEIAAEIEVYTLMTSDMLVDIPAVKAPSHIRANIQQAIRTVEPEKIIAPNFTPNVTPSKTRNIPYLAVLAAAVAILVVMNFLWLREITSLRDTQSTLDEKINLQTEILASLPAENANVTRLVSSEGEQPAPLFVIWSPEETAASLYAEDLPVLQQDQVYQLWVIGEDHVLSGGIFTVDHSGTGTLRFELPISAQDVTQFGISLEPEGGSSQPSAPPIYVGEV